MDCLSTFLTSCVGVWRPPWVFTLEVFLTEKKRWSCHVFRWMTTRVGWIDYLLIIMSIDMKGHTCHVMMCTRFCIVDLQKSKNSSLQFWNSKLEFVSSFRVLMTDQKSFQHLKSFKARGRILQILWSAGAKLYTHSFLECAHLLLTHKNSLLFMIIIYYEGLWISCCSITAFSFALSWTINCQSWLGVIHSLYTKYFG